MKFKLREEKGFTDITQNCFKVRGFIINQTISLERIMDRYISKYFSNDETKIEELIELVFSTKRIAFESKRQIFKYIVDNHNKDFLKKYPDVCSDLKKIEEHRNVFAHYYLDNSDEGEEMFKNGKMGFVEFLNKTETIYYTRQGLNKIYDMLNKYLTAFAEEMNEEV
jgi:hypothetical protein